jgi:hypothetical protein
MNLMGINRKPRVINFKVLKLTRLFSRARKRAGPFKTSFGTKGKILRGEDERVALAKLISRRVVKSQFGELYR